MTSLALHASLNKLVLDALVSVCNSNVAYNSHLEILGSIHIKADGNDVASFLINEKSPPTQPRRTSLGVQNDSMQSPTGWVSQGIKQQHFGSPMPNSNAPRRMTFGSEPRNRGRSRASAFGSRFSAVATRGRGRGHGRSLSLSSPVSMETISGGNQGSSDLDNNLNSVLQQITQLAENAAAERENDKRMGNPVPGVKSEIIELTDSDDNTPDTDHAGSNNLGIKSESAFTHSSPSNNQDFGSSPSNNQEFGTHAMGSYPSDSEDTKPSYLVKPEPQSEDVEVLRCNRCHFQCTSKLELQCHLSENCIQMALGGSSGVEPPGRPGGKPKSNAFYLCSTCQQTFSTNAMLMAHISAEHNHLRFQCPICKVVLRTRDSFNCHMNSQHNRNKVYKCPMCTKYYYTRQNLYQHKVRYHRYQSKASASMDGNHGNGTSQGADSMDSKSQYMDGSF